MSDDSPIAGGRDGVVRQSPCGAGVIAPGDPPTADAATTQAASDFLATIEIKPGSVWTLARTTVLVRLWFQGVSTSLIGEALRVTKNAIVGQAHRLHLPGRPSPIPGRTTAPQETRARTILPPLASAAPSPPPVPPPVPPPPPPVPLLPPMPVERPPPPGRAPGCAPLLRLVPPPEMSVFRGRTQTPCCWPMGEPRTPSFRFCEAPGVPGRPYCAQHMRKAYVPDPRRDDHARS